MCRWEESVLANLLSTDRELNNRMGVLVGGLGKMSSTLVD